MLKYFFITLLALLFIQHSQAQIYPNPIITALEVSADGTVAYKGLDAIELSLANASEYPIGANYDWAYASTLISGANGITLNAEELGVYTITVSISVGNDIISKSSSIEVKKIYEDIIDLNYIITHKLLDENITSPEEIDNLGLDQLQESITYMDGLGRPLQTVMTQGSPNGKDLVSIHVYDDLERESLQYLPYVEGVSGLYKANALDNLLSFYNQGNHSEGSEDYWFNDLPQTLNPYTESVFENSPLNRVTEAGTPGKSWEVIKNLEGESTGEGHTVKSRQLALADGEQVPIWEIGYNLGDEPQQVGNYTYDAGSPLWIKESEDENGMRTREYVNKKDQVLVKKVEESTDNWIETHFIYDDFNRLRYVLPPQAVEMLEDESWNYSNHSEIDKIRELVFYYNYDHRSRVVVKKVPGAGEVWMVYDQLDRLVFSQQAEQRVATRCQWNYTRYDEFSRQVQTGIATYTNIDETCMSRQDLQNLVDNLGIDYLNEEYEIGGGVPEHRVLPDSYGFVTVDGVDIYEATTGIVLSPGFEVVAVEGSSILIELNPNAETPSGIQTENFNLTLSNLPTPDFDEFLGFTFYDNYDFDPNRQYIPQGQASGYDLICEECPANNENRILDQMTATKVKILEEFADGTGSEGRWITTVSYYDDRGRMIQIQSNNHLGGLDISTMVYKNKLTDWVTKTVRRHENTSPTIHPNLYQLLSIEVNNNLDHTGRLLSSTQRIHQEGEGTPSLVEEPIASYHYNTLGELIRKDLGGEGQDALQNIDFQYNIKGWMTHINDALLDGSNNDLFGMELIYDQEFRKGNPFGDNLEDFGAAVFNGNISGIKWKSNTPYSENNSTRSYAYRYDGLNRLTGADYAASADGINDWTLESNWFDVQSISYDANGNIHNLKRYGLTDWNNSEPFGLMDDLTYNYVGNQLVGVEDVGLGTGIAGDFVDNDLVDYNPDANPQLDNFEYRYDLNGNMNVDANKGIGIIYNHLNLPERINFEGNNSIIYLYNAAGLKLRKEVREGGTLIQVTDYIGNFIYQNAELEFFTHLEGRVLPASADVRNDFVYEYHYKDHLGNLRLSFRESEPDDWTATMEPLNAPIENQDFANIAGTFDGSIGYNSPSSAELTTQTRVGPWKSIPVGKGDQLNVSTRALYEDDPNNNAGTGLPISVFINNNWNYGNYTDTEGNPQNSPFNLSNLSVGIQVTPPNSNGNDVPNAYVKVVFYDLEGNNVGEEIAFLSSLAKDEWELLSLSGEELIAPENGRAEIFVANESNVTVWFDDLHINFTPTMIVQENHYYPFGLNLAGIEKEGQPDNKFQYNGKEKQTEFDLNWSDYGARFYDYQLGIFHILDPRAEEFYTQSLFVYAANNPIALVDKNGEGPGVPIYPSLWNTQLLNLYHHDFYNALVYANNTSPYQFNEFVFQRNRGSFNANLGAAGEAAAKRMWENKQFWRGIPSALGTWGRATISQGEYVNNRQIDLFVQHKYGGGFLFGLPFTKDAAIQYADFEGNTVAPASGERGYFEGSFWSTETLSMVLEVKTTSPENTKSTLESLKKGIKQLRERTENNDYIGMLVMDKQSWINLVNSDDKGKAKIEYDSLESEGFYLHLVEGLFDNATTIWKNAYDTLKNNGSTSHVRRTY